MDHPTKSSQISLGPTVQQLKSCADKQVIGRWANNRVENSHLPFCDEEGGPCFDLDECTVYRSSLQSMPRFTIYSIRKGHSQTQYFQAKPRCCSYRVALSYRLIEFTLPRLLMLALVCLTAPPSGSLSATLLNQLRPNQRKKRLKR